jgi:hypothetical protein
MLLENTNKNVQGACNSEDKQPTCGATDAVRSMPWCISVTQEQLYIDLMMTSSHASLPARSDQTFESYSMTANNIVSVKLLVIYLKTY